MRFILLVALVLSGVCSAQPAGTLGGGLPDTLVFERVGPPEIVVNANNLVFEADTIHALYADVVVRRTLGGTDWTTGWSPSPALYRRSGKGDPRLDPDGRIYQGYPGFRYDWSDDRGATWTRADYPATVLPLHTPGGDLLGTWNRVPYGIARSEDGGATWVPGSYLPEPYMALPYVYRVLPPTDTRPAPRIVACGKEALAYSDDFRGPSPQAGIWRTTDGATWERVGQVFEDGTTVYLSPGSGGVVLGWDRGNDRVSGTDDGGATWLLLTATLTGDSKNDIKDLEVGPDGHVYAATYVFGGDTDGLFRSVAPVFAVAEEGGPGTSGDLGLRVYPNPTGGTATVALTLSAPEHVRVAVYDVQGREVALIHDGAAQGGGRFEIDTSSLPAGSYLVRAMTGSGASATAGLAVAR